MSSRGFDKLNFSQIDTLSTQLQGDERALRMSFGCKSIINGWEPEEVIVDQWPDWRSLVIKPRQNLPENYPYTLSNNVHVYTRDQNALPEFLETEGVLDWKQKINFVGIDGQIMPTLRAMAAAKGGTTEAPEVCHKHMVGTVNLEKQDQVDVELPRGYTSGTLELKDAVAVDDSWRHGKKNDSLEYIKYLIGNHLNVAVRDDRGDLVAYELVQPYGAQGMLYVDPAHRRKGLAKYIVVSLTRRMLENGVVPFCFIDEDDDLSFKVHGSCGFKIVDNYFAQWCKYSPPDG